MADVRVATEFVKSARDLSACNKFPNALGMYLCAFCVIPQWKHPLMNEFLTVLFKMNEDFAAADDTESIFLISEKAIELYPDNPYLLKEVGSYRYRYGWMDEALHHFERAINIDSGDVSAEKYINKAKTCLFARDLFRVLNDKKRNSAYRAAIRSCVTAADNVVDLDVGTGLLALYASECNPEWIDGCESSSAMVALSKSITCVNGAHNIIIGDRALVTLKYTNFWGKKCVLITDSIDSGLFGENILQSLHDAWAKFLYQNSQIIPGKAEYFVVGVKCNELNKKNSLCQEMKDILQIPYMNVHPSTLNGETYFSDDVPLYKNLKYMTEPASLFTINFNSFEDIHEKIRRQESYNAELTATDDDEINAIIGWFNLYLTDDIILTSDPRSADRATAFKQAVFFDFVSKKVQRNENISVPFLTYGGVLSMAENMYSNIKRISLETIAYLNDTALTNLITKCVAGVSVHLGQFVAMEEVDIVDLSPFPLFGVQMMRRGANSLICLAKTIDDEAFLELILEANGISRTRVTILVTEYWSTEIFKNKKFHVICSQFLDFNGDINVRMHWMVDHLKLCHLIPGGVCLPSSITVMGQLIHSKQLEVNNQISDENVGYRMAEHVNKYQVSQAIHIDIARLEYDALSDVFEVLSCNEMRSDIINVPVLNDGNCTAILCWYKVQVMEQCNEISTNRSNSFVQSTAYMINSETNQVFKGDIASVLRCIDPSDRSYKLVLNVDPH